MLKREMFFDSWEVLLRTLVVGGWLAGPGADAADFRQANAGKLNSFDLVVTVAWFPRWPRSAFARRGAGRGAVAFLVLSAYSSPWHGSRCEAARFAAWRVGTGLLLFRGEFLKQR